MNNQTFNQTLPNLTVLPVAGAAASFSAGAAASFLFLPVISSRSLHAGEYSLNIL
jgi:hypothetical protein